MCSLRPLLFHHRSLTHDGDKCSHKQCSRNTLRPIRRTCPWLDYALCTSSSFLSLLLKSPRQKWIRSVKRPLGTTRGTKGYTKPLVTSIYLSRNVHHVHTKLGIWRQCYIGGENMMSLITWEVYVRNPAAVVGTCQVVGIALLMHMAESNRRREQPIGLRSWDWKSQMSSLLANTESSWKAAMYCCWS